ncbi:MAG: hypothetical protein U0528_15175 [Anaerolineae bacterium]|nr:hypothetical protein [Anaerolineae bacterium]
MPEYRGSLKNRARKTRIHKAERNAVIKKIRKLEAITPDQRAALQKLVAANARGEMLSASSIANWRELREMGVVRESDGKLTVTSIGMEVAADNS